MERGEVAEVTPGAGLFGRPPVDPYDLGQGAPAVAQAFDEVALAQAVTADQRGGDGRSEGVARRLSAARR